MHVVSEDVHEDRQGNDNDEAAAERLKKIRRPGRRDALTKKPLDYDQEEETRKSETNKWLEHHFGSESGRSEDSFQEDTVDKVNSSGGNRITITMSPYPASNEDVPDRSSPSTRWTKDSTRLNSSSKGPPPPPPPKPERIWSSKVESPISPTSKSFPKQVHEIHDSELAAARSRLRSTGLNLTEENKENNAPDLSRNISHELKMNPTKESEKYSSPSQKKFSTLKEDVIYSSKFRSGNPKKSFAPLAPDTTSSTIIRAESPPLATTVGRSQSFNVQTLPWSAFKKESSSKYKSSVKDYRSEERLDDIDSRKPYRDYSPYTNQTNHWNSDRSSKFKSKFITEDKTFNTKSSWSPPREPTPPPPPRPSRRSPVNKSRNTVEFGKEAATQTGPTPIPPPRTKRKKRPKNSYFFGQDSDSSLYTTYSTMPNGFSNRHSAHEPLYSNNFKNEGKYYTENSLPSTRRSPKIEKRYKTTKTITPVLVIPYEERSERYRNRDYSYENLNKSAWTNTVDPRRRPRISTEEERSTTLPRKHLSSSSMSNPKKTYIFGESGDTNGSKHNNRYSNSYIGSVNNVSTNHGNSDIDYNRFSSLNTKLINKNSKPVGRSQSFNVQAGKSYPQPILNGRTFSEIKDQKTSTAYGSTPYVNLRSPNLIASIARTSSNVYGSDFYENVDAGNKNEQDSENKDKFRKGLLNNAPELYHFIHGNEDEDEKPSKGHSKPTVDVSQLYSQPYSKSPSYSARVFTFGKSDTNTLTRTPSQGASNEDENIRNTYATSTYSTEENNKRNSILNNPNRRSTFNLKASGSSLLYSPSFRNQQHDIDDKQNSSGSSVGKERYSGDFSSTKLSSGVRNENPVFIQVRDWNMR
ncbi:hypothetical protein Avbf_06817 [Armadillidium vulgare]|nr:hypothetical protein Avbf_06817 [Armadillidium vulgare]